jgi:multidrug resistance efflux pump
MKKLVMFFTVCLICGSAYAATEKPAIARVASYLEGIVDMKVTLGQHVKKGQLLFEIETDFTQIMKDKALNGLWYYKESYNRVKKLSKTHAKSVEELQEADYNLKNAEGTLQVQKLFMNKWSKYYAPFDGVVTKICNYSGSGVSNGSGNCDNNDAVLEVTKLEDFEKGNVKVGSAVAQIVPMVDGIVEVKVTTGEKVKKGQVLFNISTAYNEITKAQQKAKVKYNKAKYERTKHLYEQRNDSLKSYQLSEYDYKNAVQDLKGTELIINKRSTYCAPFDGTVTEIFHYTGSNVFVGHKVLEVAK